MQDQALLDRGDVTQRRCVLVIRDVQRRCGAQVGGALDGGDESARCACGFIDSAEHHPALGAAGVMQVHDVPVAAVGEPLFTHR